jgi:hypothetical protein
MAVNQDDLAPVQNPWRERRDLNPVDRKLRALGFSILARVKDNEPLWWRDGRSWTQSEAAKEIE